MTESAAAHAPGNGWNRRNWIIWLVCVSTVFLAQFLYTGGLACRVETVPFTLDGRTHRGLLFSREGPVTELVLAAHGTNSHREIFMPLAWETTRRGIALFTFDSATVTTDEGVEIRRRELESALNAVSARHIASLTFHLAGHSDGVPPILALGAEPSHDRLRTVSLLGSFATHHAALVATLSAFVGTLDQVFPVSEIRASLDENSRASAPLHLSRLSDHFTEQYDPLLITAIADFMTGKRGSALDSARALLRLALLSVLAFLGGTQVAGRGVAFRACFVAAALAAWLSGSLFEWPRGAAVSGLLGMLAGPIPVTGAFRFVTGFWGLMALNVAAASAHFRNNIHADIFQLPLMMFWYLPAWIVKLTLFLVSFVRRADPIGLEPVPTPLLVLAAAALFIPALPGRIRRLQPSRASASSSASDRSRWMAAILLIVMAGLWGVRFLQGFVRLEILASMAATYLRTLLLPTAWLLWTSISALRASDSSGTDNEPRAAR